MIAIKLRLGKKSCELSTVHVELSIKGRGEGGKNLRTLIFSLHHDVEHKSAVSPGVLKTPLMRSRFPLLSC